MASGKLVHWHAFEIKCHMEVTDYDHGSGYATLIANGSAGSEYTRDDSVTTNGIRLLVQSRLGGSGSALETGHFYRLLIGPIESPIYDATVTGGTFKTVMDTHVVFHGVRLYADGDTYTFIYDSFTWFIEGEEHVTIAAGAELSGVKFRATDIPLLGIPVQLVANAAADPDIAFEPGLET